jgi:hypothetical protein
MAAYQIWILDADYTPVKMLPRYLLSYRQALNGVGQATVKLALTDPNIAVVAPMARLRVIRNGDDVWGGLIQTERLALTESAPMTEHMEYSANDHAIYGDWQPMTPDPGQAYDTYTDHLDDVAKAVVSKQLVTNLGATDISVQADAHEAASGTLNGRYNPNVLETLRRLANAGGFDWRFVPDASGAEFQTAYPIWGTDRTQGNGVNSEVVWTLDRRNVRNLTYAFDLCEHYNHIIAAGQGELADRVIGEGEDAAYIASYLRRTAFVEDTRYSTVGGLESVAAERLVEYAPRRTLTALPKVDSWRDSWDLGDLVTIRLALPGRTIRVDVQIVAVNVEVDAARGEVVTPEVKEVEVVAGSGS